VFVQSASGEEEPHPEPLAGAVVLEDHRIAETLRCLRDVLLAGDRKRLRRLDAELPQ
jgi:hypothetical protein